MYRSELLFVEKLIASFKLLKVNEIPLGNEKFQKGVDKMHHYFNMHFNEFKKFSNEISLLFLKRPIEGTYDEMSDALLELNGHYLSLAVSNPYYERATIKLEYLEASQIFKNDLSYGRSSIFSR